MSTPRIVIDTNILVAALRSRRGWSHALISRLGQGLFRPVVSVPLVLEYERAVASQRPAITLSDMEVAAVLDYICTVSEHRRIHYLWRPFLPDPGDDMVLELAFEARCDYIVTFNTRDFRGCDQLGVGVTPPREFLEQLGVRP